MHQSNGVDENERDLLTYGCWVCFFLQCERILR